VWSLTNCTTQSSQILARVESQCCETNPRDEISEFDNSMFELHMLESASCVLQHLGNSARDSKQAGGVMDQQQKFNYSKLGWTVDDELARSLSVSVPFSSA
jgi:hypothetical protein